MIIFEECTALIFGTAAVTLGVSQTEVGEGSSGDGQAGFQVPLNPSVRIDVAVDIRVER